MTWGDGKLAMASGLGTEFLSSGVILAGSLRAWNLAVRMGSLTFRQLS